MSTTADHDVRTMCGSCGTWFWAGDGHACPPSSPTNLPWLTPAGTTIRYHVADDRTLIKRAVLKHDAAPALEGAAP